MLILKLESNGVLGVELGPIWPLME